MNRYPLPQSGLVYRYLTTPEGELAFALSSNDGHLAMERLTDNKWVLCPVDLEHIDIVTAGDEPGQVVVVGPRQEGKPRPLQLMDAATGKLGEVLLQDQGYESIFGK